MNNALITAEGYGQRMGASIPKQFVEVKSMLGMKPNDE